MLMRGKQSLLHLYILELLTRRCLLDARDHRLPVHGIGARALVSALQVGQPAVEVQQALGLLLGHLLLRAIKAEGHRH